VYAVITPEEWAQAARKIFSHIIETGSIRAFDVLAERLAGKVPQHVRHEDIASPEDWLAALADDSDN
jgi:hypothetical protein